MSLRHAARRSVRVATQQVAQDASRSSTLPVSNKVVTLAEIEYYGAKRRLLLIKRGPMRMRDRRRRRIAVGTVSLGLSLLVWAWLASSDGHDEMIALLDQVQQRTASENPFLGDAGLTTLNAQLEQKQQGNARILLLWQQGTHLLRIGRTEAAIEAFEAHKRMLPTLREQVPAQIIDGAEREVLFMLAVAHLRRGEMANCVHCQTAESCIVPIQGKGVHHFCQRIRQ